jgi:hypothetical protein
VLEGISNPETVHGLHGSLQAFVAHMLPLIPGKMRLAHEKNKMKKLRALGRCQESTSKDIIRYVYIWNTRLVIIRWDVKFGSTETPVTSRHFMPYSMSWIDNPAGFKHCKLQEETWVIWYEQILWNYHWNMDVVNKLTLSNQCMLSSWRRTRTFLGRVGKVTHISHWNRDMARQSKCTCLTMHASVSWTNYQNLLRGPRAWRGIYETVALLMHQLPSQYLPSQVWFY